ncbi:MAG: OsmC family peroxiredoxin [Candidatus Dormibacteraeota bacterium]|jgi:lipoyl-dependent peroxiredoxin|nr:OsmC family peroxiredoxin [Candidatus Dormibacteraeota bacterium]MDQ6921106.1 OsmC family peroxiredoxin [Candidatus Dormibacteraeota bacterium]
MAVQSRADATWEGDLLSGAGHVTPASGAFPELQLTWRARSESRDSGTSPEELLAAAHAACYSMALSLGLAQAGHAPERLDTSARVGFQAGEGITGVELSVRGQVPGLDAEGFRQAAEAAKETCPVSKALAGVKITLAEAELV